jgi:hypothetical protein
MAARVTFRMSDPSAIYLDAALSQVWRLATLVDRNPHSRTRGSFSRTHWGWKFIDFPYPRMQEGVYAMARLRGIDDSRNPLRQSAAVEQWIAWGFENWTSRQHSNGAFDEAYPFEQCLAATAFTSFYLGHAYQRCGGSLERGLRERLVATFARAGGWLTANDETHGLLSNHLAVAVAALELIARITGDSRYSKRARFYLDRILAHQSAEGWMQEYDGADIGYGTHGLFYLADYWRMTSCAQTLDACNRFADFLKYFVHPDGTIGGEYGSRNTEFYYPAGFEILAPHSPACAAIASGLRPAIEQRRVAGVWAVDDFNFMPMLNNLLFAADAAAPLTSAGVLPHAGEAFDKRFPHCGIWIVNTPAHYSVLGLSKGGTVSVFDKGSSRLAARHSGLLILDNGRAFTSQDYTLSPQVSWQDEGRSATIEVPWKSVGTTVFSTWLFLAFRLFTVTVGRSAAISARVKALLVHALIRRKRRPPVTHRRTIRVADTGVEIADVVSGAPAGATLQAVEHFTAVHMGSSLYPDIRIASATGETPSWTVPVDGRLRLTGSLGLGGARWHDEH